MSCFYCPSQFLFSFLDIIYLVISLQLFTIILLACLSRLAEHLEDVRHFSFLIFICLLLSKFAFIKLTYRLTTKECAAYFGLSNLAVITHGNIMLHIFNLFYVLKFLFHVSLWSIIKGCGK